MNWLWWKKPPPSEDHVNELEEARAIREEAERKLRESQIAARQVRMAAVTARIIRADNQFSDRLNQVFRSRPSG